MLRVSPDDPLVRGLFTKAELAGMRKLQTVKRGKRKGELTTVQEIELGLESRGLDAGMVREHRFALPQRKWMFDFAWPDIKIAVEYEGLVMRKDSGGQWQTGGRHATITGMREDMAKYNAAALLGWRVLRYEKGLVTNGKIYDDLFKVLVP